MPSPRTCSHVKINGVKCGSPALKYHTHCYFHYQWLHRRTHPYHYDRKEGWTTMTLPPLESKASILFAICEIQQSLLDGSIDFRTAKALFYGIQLAIQLRATDELDAQETPDTCHELTEELEKARWRHERPPQVVCDSCTRADACLDATNCHHTTEQIRELERLHEPERYARQLKDEEYEKEQQRKNQELWDKKIAEDKAYNEERARKLALNSTSTSTTAPRLPQSANVGSTTPSLSTTPAAITPTLNPCHGERSAAISRAAEPPFVSPTQAPAPTSTTAAVTAPPANACHHERSEGSASSPTTTNLNPNTPPSTCFEGASLDSTCLEGASLDSTRLEGASLDSTRLEGARLQPCRNEAEETGALAPEVHTLNSSTALPLESSPARQCGEDTEQDTTSRATARRQISDRKLFHSPAQFARLESRALNEINILRSNS